MIGRQQIFVLQGAHNLITQLNYTAVRGIILRSHPRFNVEGVVIFIFIIHKLPAIQRSRRVKLLDFLPKNFTDNLL